MLDLVIEREKVRATNGKITVSRELISALLKDLETRAGLGYLSTRERESLEQLAVAVISDEVEIAVSREVVDVLRSSIA